jgi:glutathione S-transferase
MSKGSAPTLEHIPKTISSPIVQCMIELDLLEKNTITIHQISFADLKMEAHLAINPMGTAPAFHDGDIILWESGAILDFLLERYDVEHKLHPPPISESSSHEMIATRAKYLQLKQYIIATVYPFIASLFIHTLRPLEQQDLVYIASAKNKWTTLMGPILTEWVGDGPWFLGNQLSAVDILSAKPLNNVNSMGLLHEFPKLKDLFERISSRPSFARAYEQVQDESPEAAEQTRALVFVPSEASPSKR